MVSKESRVSNMDFVRTLLKLAPVTSALACGKSTGDVASTLVIQAEMKKLENMFMEAADAYTSGYRSLNKASLSKFGISAALSLVVYLAAKVYAGATETTKEEEKRRFYLDKMLPVVSAASTLVVALIVIGVMRRQKTFRVFSGTDMISSYALFFVVPFVVLSAGARLGSGATIQNSAIGSGAASLAFLLLSKKLYFVYKQNELERNVFSQLSDVFESCPDYVASSCTQEHGEFLTAFVNSVQPYLTQISRLLPEPIKAATVAKRLSDRQVFDTLVSFT